MSFSLASVLVPSTPSSHVAVSANPSAEEPAQPSMDLRSSLSDWRCFEICTNRVFSTVRGCLTDASIVEGEIDSGGNCFVERSSASSSNSLKGKWERVIYENKVVETME